MTSNPLSRRREFEPEQPRYVARTPEEEAQLRNEALAIRSPHRAGEIEWYAGQDGHVYLRDKPRVTVARTQWLEKRAEDERAAWKGAQRKAGNL